jgi:hypothetical protein
MFDGKAFLFKKRFVKIRVILWFAISAYHQSYLKLYSELSAELPL